MHIQVHIQVHIYICICKYIYIQIHFSALPGLRKLKVYSTSYLQPQQPVTPQYLPDVPCIIGT